MKYRYLGRSGLLVSRICLGTMTFGNKEWGCDLDTSRAIVNAFVEGGGNFIDTADAYVNGESERILCCVLSTQSRLASARSASVRPPCGLCATGHFASGIGIRGSPPNSRNRSFGL